MTIRSTVAVICCCCCCLETNKSGDKHNENGAFHFRLAKVKRIGNIKYKNAFHHRTQQSTHKLQLCNTHFSRVRYNTKILKFGKFNAHAKYNNEQQNTNKSRTHVLKSENSLQRKIAVCAIFHFGMM